MSFFDTYDITLLSFNLKNVLPEHHIRFLKRWFAPSNTLCFSIHPILESRLVTPAVLPLETELMNAKLAIDAFHTFDPKKEQYYTRVTRLIDPFSFYRKIVQKQISPARSMTNAWLKCWEMIHVFQLIPSKGHVQLFCNAELPGAFLFALNHYIKTKTTATYDWVANSLYPSDGKILGDEFGLVQRYPEKWLMSKEHSGSVTDPAMIQRMMERCPRNIDVYTSDIGIGLDYDTFAKQEELEAPLHLGQIICGLSTLKEGGHLVCKTFMFFSPFSISLMYLTSQCFSDFSIYKPETSRAANSEVYIIGKGFRIRNDIIDQLKQVLMSWTNECMTSYMLPVPEDFYLTIFIALHRIYQRQIHYITQNIQTAKTLYESGAPADFQHVRTTYFWKTEQQRLTEWKKRLAIPYLNYKDAL